MPDWPIPDWPVPDGIGRQGTADLCLRILRTFTIITARGRAGMWPCGCAGRSVISGAVPRMPAMSPSAIRRLCCGLKNGQRVNVVSHHAQAGPVDDLSGHGVRLAPFGQAALADLLRREAGDASGFAGSRKSAAKLFEQPAR